MTDTPNPARRKRVITLFLLVVVLAGLAGGGWYFWKGRWYETTSNAYLTGNLVEVSAQVSGNVVWIGPEQNQLVNAGEVILRLADGDERQALALREQELALAVQEVLVFHARIERLEAEQRLRAITHKLAREEYERRKRLQARNLVAEEELDAAETRQQETLALMETARLDLQEARVRAGSSDLANHPQVMAAAARLRSSYRDWRKTRMVAPVAGEIARRRVQAGQRVQAGMPLFTLTQRASAWVEANFKETQLRHIRPGQQVQMHSDLYGDTVTLSGRVDSIGTGTGSVFSLLPAQNATGNWIKIVQRVPVRITLDTGFDRDYPLPFGASVDVRIDTHDRSGPPLLPDSEVEPVVSTDIYGYQEDGADELINRIITTASRQAQEQQGQRQEP